MQSLKATVRNGKLIVDETPTDLPEGTEVELVVVEDEFESEDKARLLQSIEEGFEDIDRGNHMAGFDFIAQLRAKREAANR